MFYRIFVFNLNSEDPDQTPRTAASDLGLHCLPMSLLWDARYNWVKKSRILTLFSSEIYFWDGDKNHASTLYEFIGINDTKKYLLC